jgi:Ser/Thr protein kinase RdoA (MazF antagonist)
MSDHSQRALPAGAVLASFGIEGSVRGWGLAARSANGEIWRLDLGEPERSFAVKRAVHESFSGEQVKAEIDYRDAAVDAGIEAPVPITSAFGRYVETVEGASVRVSTWVSGRTPRRTEPGRADWLGQALGIMHGLRYPADGYAYVTGGPGVPDPNQWRELARLAAVSGQPWSDQFAAAEPTLRAIGAGWATDSGKPQVVSHRDVQPSNVIFDPRHCSYILVDWDGVGLVNPARELVSRLITWHVHDAEIDHDGIDGTMRAYRNGGGIAEPEPADAFGGAPDALGYLSWQVRLALDSRTLPATRAHASAEVQALLDESCPPEVLEAVAEIAMRY